VTPGKSPAIYITRKLLAEHAEVVISDPKALKNAAIDLASDEGRSVILKIHTSRPPAAMLWQFLTDWELYGKLDFQKIYKSMVKPAFIFDGRNIIDHKNVLILGLMFIQSANRTKPF